MPEMFTGGGLEAAVSAASADTTAAAESTSVDSTNAAADVSSAAGVATTGQAATDESTATTQVDPATQAQTTKTGPIPFETHKTALENARTKAAQEVEGQYAWAKSIPEPHRQTVSQFYQLLDAEPTQAVEVLIGQIAADPQHAPKLRSLFGRLLGNRAANPQTSSQPANGGGLPEPDFRDDTTGASFYSAERMKDFVSAIEARITTELSKKYGPLEQDFRTRQQRAADDRAKADAASWADKEYARISQYPHFTEHQAAIGAAMEANPELGVQDAYIQVVIPKLQQQERQSVVASLHDKANASGINPANPATATQKAPRNFEEAFAQLPASAIG